MLASGGVEQWIVRRRALRLRLNIGGKLARALREHIRQLSLRRREKRNHLLQPGKSVAALARQHATLAAGMAPARRWRDREGMDRSAAAPVPKP